LQIIFVGADHRYDAVLQRVAGVGHVVDPLVFLDRPVGGRAAFADLVVLALEPDPGADDLLQAVAPAEQREPATVVDEAGGFPRDVYVIAVVIDLDLHVEASTRRSRARLRRT